MLNSYITSNQHMVGMVSTTTTWYFGYLKGKGWI